MKSIVGSNPSDLRGSAIDEEFDTVDVAAFIRGKEKHRDSHFFRQTGALERSGGRGLSLEVFYLLVAQRATTTWTPTSRPSRSLSGSRPARAAGT